ncbi:hypothetical protein [Pandoravirus japonicus]|uniref:Uncharacterized protein n=1 Tax=Pandoravirus japonicus TaxID=2823154 RepID=A0A811BQ49_9VIRU|nr:hypothetical protein [Pandoravirus japonicus]
MHKSTLSVRDLFIPALVMCARTHDRKKRIAVVFLSFSKRPRKGRRAGAHSNNNNTRNKTHGPIEAHSLFLRQGLLY